MKIYLHVLSYLNIEWYLKSFLLEDKDSFILDNQYHNFWWSEDVNNQDHYIDVIMSAMASQITSFTIVYSTVYLGADQRKHQSFVSLALWGEFTGDRWIPRTKGQWRRKCFHWMTSSWLVNVVLVFQQYSDSIPEGQYLYIIYVYIYRERDSMTKVSASRTAVQFLLQHYSVAGRRTILLQPCH